MSSKRNRQMKKKRDTQVGLGLDIPAIGKGSLSINHKSAPVARSLRTTTKPPSVNGNKSFVVRHTEYLLDLIGTADFSLVQLPIQPGIDLSFPWLSSIASNFEEYRIRSLRYRTETQSPSTNAGTIMMAIDYDPADGAPLGKLQLMTKAGATRCASWDNAVCPAMASRRPFTRLFMRAGGLTPNLDIKTYDYGNILVGVEGSSIVGSSIAELYVDYEVEFFTPESAGNSEIASGSWVGTFNGIAKLTPFLTAPVSVGGDLTIRFTSSTTFVVDRVGTYMVHYRVTGTGLINNTSSIVIGNPGNSGLTNFAAVLNQGIVTGATLITGTVGGLLDKLSIAQGGDGYSVNLNALGGTVTSLTLTISPISTASDEPVPVRPGKQTIMSSRIELDRKRVDGCVGESLRQVPLEREESEAEDRRSFMRLLFTDTPVGEVRDCQVAELKVLAGRMLGGREML